VAASPEPFDFDARKQLLDHLSAPGGPLSDGTPSSSHLNPEWFGQGEQVTASRNAIHAEMRKKFRAQRPNVKRERRAIVLAGPPGAGKSSARQKLLIDLGSTEADWRDLNADDFKDQLLLQAARDGSLDHELAPVGTETLTPRERASLVHEESSLLMKQEQRRAIRRGENIIIDGTLGNESKAALTLDRLVQNGYTVDIIAVDGPKQITRARAEHRWKTELAASARDDADEIARLGGRAVPPGFIDQLYENDDESICSGIARRVADTHPNVESFQQYLVPRADAAPELVTKLSGRRADGRWARRWTLPRPAAGTESGDSVVGPEIATGDEVHVTGDVAVKTYLRNGHPVSGYVRRRISKDQ